MGIERKEEDIPLVTAAAIEPKITPEMIAAGASVLWTAEVADGYWAESLAEAIFKAMRKIEVSPATNHTVCRPEPRNVA